MVTVDMLQGRWQHSIPSLGEFLVFGSNVYLDHGRGFMGRIAHKDGALAMCGYVASKEKSTPSCILWQRGASCVTWSRLPEAGLAEKPSASAAVAPSQVGCPPADAALSKSLPSSRKTGAPDTKRRKLDHPTLKTASLVDHQQSGENQPRTYEESFRKTVHAVPTPSRKTSLARFFAPGQWLTDSCISHVYEGLLAQHGGISSAHGGTPGSDTDKMLNSVLLMSPAEAFWLSAEKNAVFIDQALREMQLGISWVIVTFAWSPHVFFAGLGAATVPTRQDTWWLFGTAGAYLAESMARRYSVRQTSGTKCRLNFGRTHFSL